MSPARVVSINRSAGGVPKLSIPEVRITRDGLDLDAHVYHRHGGPDKAVCLYALERIQALQAEGHPIDIGTTGENLTVAGLDWDAVVPGVRFDIGGVELECTEWAQPCATIAGSFHDGRSGRIGHKTHPGWSRIYARVRVEGTVRVGAPVHLLPMA
jgi:MOSC domain-containing protein YiiM